MRDTQRIRHACRRAQYVAAIGISLALALGPSARSQNAGASAPDVAKTLAVQFTDASLQTPNWRRNLDLAAELGVSVVRVDLNWPWTETETGRYAWSVYDDFAVELSRRKLRPLFILHRPNRLHGRPLTGTGAGTQDAVIAPPRSPSEIAAFAKWAAAAAVHFRSFEPIWEIWNEPDGEGFWPPHPNPAEYTRLARATCSAIKGAVPDAFVIGPAAAEMPTVWDPTKPLVNHVLKDAELMLCLNAVSLHTHRFGQAPETVSRDYAVYRKARAEISARDLPVFDTEWGDSVFRAGLSEAQQATWLPRMMLTNLMENVALTNWYCLVDTGDDDDEMEDRFGLTTRTGRQRPAYRAYRTLSRALHGHALRTVIARFDRESAKGTTLLLFCAADSTCKLAAWTTDERDVAVPYKLPGWALAGPIVGHLGQTLPALPQDKVSVTLAISTDAQFTPVRPLLGTAK